MKLDVVTVIWINIFACTCTSLDAFSRGQAQGLRGVVQSH